MHGDLTLHLDLLILEFFMLPPFKLMKYSQTITVMAMDFCHGLLYQWSTFAFDYITKYHTELEGVQTLTCPSYLAAQSCFHQSQREFS